MPLWKTVLQMMRMAVWGMLLLTTLAHLAILLARAAMSQKSITHGLPINMAQSARLWVLVYSGMHDVDTSLKPPLWLQKFH